jgi:beta-hydroxylase
MIELLEANWEDIRDECLQASGYTEWPEYSIYSGRWDVYGIYDFQSNLIPEHAKECPKTVSALQQIPGLKTAGFSRLEGGCHIVPHKGYSGDVLRCHLGLVIPEGDCALKVEETVYRWEEGKAFIFNDRLLHEAWNRTSLPRYVLIVDFLKP